MMNPAYGVASKAKYTPPNAYIVIDAETGKVLSHEDSERTLYPASLTKVMTLLLVFEALESGTIKMSSKIPFSTYAASMPPSKIGVKAGQSITVEQAIKALVTKSANDVAVAVGEKLGGSVNRFARMMNAKAQALGMNQTRFVNPSGLHHPNQTSSPRDMAKLALYILRKYPEYYPVFSTKAFTFRGKTMNNHNRLMNTYRGMDGFKTGYISQSGFNLIASAERSGVRLVGVVFGGSSAVARNNQMADLLDDGFFQMRVRQGDERTAHYHPKRKTYDSVTASVSPPTPILKTLPKKEEAKKSSPRVTYQLTSPSSAPPAARKTAIKSEPVLKTITSTKELTNTLSGEKLESLRQTHRNNTEASALANGSWVIQIGAFQDRLSTDQAIYRALQTLPSPLNRGNPMIVPLRTAEATWVFRARIGGYTREQAAQACRVLNDCLTIAPTTN